MAKLIKGKSQDIIDANIKALKDEGRSHNHATHLALKHANKNHTAHAKRIAAKVVKKDAQVTIKK